MGEYNIFANMCKNLQRRVGKVYNKQTTARKSEWGKEGDHDDTG